MEITITLPNWIIYIVIIWMVTISVGNIFRLILYILERRNKKILNKMKGGNK